MDKYIEQDCREYITRIDLSPLKGKTVLITGANGLIGTYLIYMLHLSNLENGTGINIEAVSRSSPNKALSEVFEKSYRFRSLDLNSPASLDMLQKADYIIHGATYAQPEKFLRNYLDTIHLNTVVTEKLLQKAQIDNAGFLFLSSSEVYGEPDEGNIPTPEEFPGLCSPVNIRAIYSEAKRMGETLCFAYRNHENVDARIARISMTYGPGVSANDERVLSQFIRQALSRKEIIMLDSGSKVRTFCYVSDCALMLLNIMLYGTKLVYNVGGKESITIRKLAEEICTITGSKLSAENPEQASAEKVKVSPQHVELNISRICSEFGLNSFKPMSEGLKRTIEWIGSWDEGTS
ncbi:MAG TPA: NAD-dependent epimerase/dehydratase family protein [Ruminiclostridium sp.]|nr:NAD-dependent epimerase/dehydratase family protein [Ruminiclostridium sp.]